MVTVVYGELILLIHVHAAHLPAGHDDADWRTFGNEHQRIRIFICSRECSGAMWHRIPARAAIAVSADVPPHTALHHRVLPVHAADSLLLSRNEAKPGPGAGHAVHRDPGSAVVHHLVHPLRPQDDHRIPAARAVRTTIRSI